MKVRKPSFKDQEQSGQKFYPRVKLCSVLIEHISGHDLCNSPEDNLVGAYFLNRNASHAAKPQL